MIVIRYLVFTTLVLVGLIYALSKLQIVQDFLLKRAVLNQVSSFQEFPDDALSALVCGSGSPIPAENIAETCILIKAGENYYIIDSGGGSVENLFTWQIDFSKIKAVFLTHLHSDHISDLPNLHLNTWIAQQRQGRLQVYGPRGVKRVTEGFEKAYELDYIYRHIHHGNNIAPLDNVGFDANTIDVLNEVFYQVDDLKVTAFEVEHDPVTPALGFRYEDGDRSIVLSGDTKYSQKTIDAARNADVLFHEAQANHLLSELEDGLISAKRVLTAKIMEDILSYHTTPVEAAMIANQANVDHLVFYHLVPYPRNNLMAEIFVRGVDDIRENWTLSKDGTLVVLPLNSDSIEISLIK